ncbi:unnamed protein product, partial [Rotaria magnacalcarata]
MLNFVDYYRLIISIFTSYTIGLRVSAVILALVTYFISSKRHFLGLATLETLIDYVLAYQITHIMAYSLKRAEHSTDIDWTSQIVIVFIIFPL